MVKGVFWIFVAVVNIYLGSFLTNAGQRNFQLVVALYCTVIAIWYFYAASRGVK